MISPSFPLSIGLFHVLLGIALDQPIVCLTPWYQVGWGRPIFARWVSLPFLSASERHKNERRWKAASESRITHYSTKYTFGIEAQVWYDFGQRYDVTSQNPRVQCLLSTKCPRISPIVWSGGRSRCLNNRIFQNITFYLWVHSIEISEIFQIFLFLANILLKRMFFFFANWLKLGRDVALVFCDIFKTLVECLTYVAAGGWVAPLTSHFPPKRLLPCKNSGRAQKAKVFRFLHNCEIIHGGKLRPSFCFFSANVKRWLEQIDRKTETSLINSEHNCFMYKLSQKVFVFRCASISRTGSDK